MHRRHRQTSLQPVQWNGPIAAGATTSLFYHRPYWAKQRTSRPVLSCWEESEKVILSLSVLRHKVFITWIAEKCLAILTAGDQMLLGSPFFYQT
jgi:hypothetical protein